MSKEYVVLGQLTDSQIEAVENLLKTTDPSRILTNAAIACKLGLTKSYVDAYIQSKQ